MKHFPVLAALGIGLIPISGLAQVQPYYHTGAWEAFSGRETSGAAVCGIATTSGPRRLATRMNVGATDTVVTASKQDWSIPDNTRIAVVIQIGLNTPWVFQASGHDTDISWSLDQKTMQSFDQQFRTSPSMTVTFPDGNEPPWSLPLNGSTAVSSTLERCIRDLARQVQAGQPPTSSTPQPQAATQPFNVPNASPATATSH